MKKSDLISGLDDFMSRLSGEADETEPNKSNPAHEIPAVILYRDVPIDAYQRWLPEDRDVLLECDAITLEEWEAMENPE